MATKQSGVNTPHMKGGEHMYTFNTCCDEYLNVNHIFPTQQRDVLKIIKALKPTVKKLIIFGSSVTPSCNPWSDIDIYAEMDKNERPINTCLTENPMDIWTNYTVDENLKNEILNTGVIVYERRDII